MRMQISDMLDCSLIQRLSLRLGEATLVLICKLLGRELW